MSLINKINSIVSIAFKKAGFEQPVEIKKSDREELGDFQCNSALIIAKMLQKNPREIASIVVSKINSPEIEKISIDGPGFINITLKNSFLEENVNKIKDDKNLGFEIHNPETIVMDYVGMNIAKVMHVGHLRSCVYGQSIVNLGRFVGHKMIGDAHLGD
jgi:arginyl-tRNA synthetase